MASVFTHQSPYVKWGSGTTRKRCELADLLLAVIDRTSSSAGGVAVLVQAKLSTTGSVTLSTKSEKTQFDLLSTRPVFDVDSKAAPTQIDLGHRAPNSALIYGLTGPSSTSLPSRFPGLHHWLTSDDLLWSPGTPTVASKDCLAYLLAGMLRGKFGWRFDLPPMGGSWRSIAAAAPLDDWSILINYLLEETFAKPLSATYGSSMGRPSRGQDDVLYFTAKNSVGQPNFFLGYELFNSMAMKCFVRDIEADNGDWQLGDLDEAVSFSGGGDSTGGGERPATDDPSAGGPISAILFEVGDQS
jgi:hypothetical protein